MSESSKQQPQQAKLLSAGRRDQVAAATAPPDYFILSKVHDRDQFFAVGGASSGAMYAPIARNTVSLEFL